MEKPIVITLELEAEAKAFFNEQRKLYFPSHINYLDAHLTLFHALPPNEMIIEQTLEKISKRDFINLEITGLKHIGNGVVYMISSPVLQVLHKSMQQSFKSFLIGKDKQVLWPHITIQNKVTDFKSKLLYEKLAADFKAFTVKGIGISSFLYDGGPWIHQKDFPFSE